MTFGGGMMEMQKNKESSEYIYSPNSRLTKLKHILRKYYKVVSFRSYSKYSYSSYLTVYYNDYVPMGDIVYDEDLNKPWGFIVITWDISKFKVFKHYEHIMSLDGYSFYRVDCSDL